MKTSIISRLALSTVAALALAVPASNAQCFGDDNLDNGPCCGLTQANLPDFPGVQMGGLGVCWDACAVVDKNNIRVEWGTLNQTVCGQYVTPLRVIDGATGTILLDGPMTLDYSRTWIEIDPTGIAHQVWRFVAKVDLTATAPAGAVPPCPVPLNLVQNPNATAFFYGYLDYVDCQTTPGFGPRNALVLYHPCDRFMHTPGFSSQPGAAHGDDAFAIVAPHNAAQPFTPVNQKAPGGPVIEGATRNVSPSPQVCFVEDQVSVGSIAALAAGCLCTVQKNPKQHTIRDFNAMTTCPSPVGVPGDWDSQAVNFPTLPWFEMVTTSIGFWSTPGLYPGEESAWADEGLFIHQDVCQGSFIEIKYGGSTNKGWDALSFAGNQLGSFTDIADNWSAPLFGPYNLPIFGSSQPTDRVIHVNLAP